MVKRYRLGSATITLLGKTKHLTIENLITDKETGFRVIREEAGDNPTDNLIRYSLMYGMSTLAFIGGYQKTPTKFHIERVENSIRDKNGFKYIPQIYEAMENDLRERGVKYITTHSLASLAHTEVRRYGFYDVGGRSYEKLKDSWLRKIPWKAVSLEKRL